MAGYDVVVLINYDDTEISELGKAFLKLLLLLVGDGSGISIITRKAEMGRSQTSILRSCGVSSD